MHMHVQASVLVDISIIAGRYKKLWLELDTKLPGEGAGESQFRTTGEKA